MVLSAMRIVHYRNQLTWRRCSLSNSFFIISPLFILRKGEKSNMILKASNQIYSHNFCFMTGLAMVGKNKSGTKMWKQKTVLEWIVKSLTIPFKMVMGFPLNFISTAAHRPRRNTFSAKLTGRSNNNNNSFYL